MIDVEIVYATAENQTLITVQVPKGTTVAQAIEFSGILIEIPSLIHCELNTLKVGIFSVCCSNERTLIHGERIEIYRPLQNDPKEMRRLRATAVKCV